MSPAEPSKLSEGATAPLPNASVASVQAGSDNLLGTHIAEFEIIGELGRGGMGVVYLARQSEPVQRTVALKLIQTQIRSARARALFRIEAQALAQMEHPAIARVFSAGRTEQGQPWFAMERIDGVTLGQYLKQHQPPAATDLATQTAFRNSLLRLFVAICQGVHHAHQKGVIHRDLKLGNIMITELDGQPQPKIIDFGLALGVAGSRRAPIDRSGTRDYMSPEQRQGDPGIDIRSDVYALGVILLKMLAPPRFFELREATSQPGSLPELVSRSLGKERVDAQIEASLQSLRAIAVELRWILRRALALGRDERYGSARELGQDLEHFLANRPVEAMPDSGLYRLRKFVRRHQPAVLASIAAGLFLLSGAIAATIGFVRADRERQRAENALSLARTEADKARRVAGFLEDLLGGVAPDVARGMDTRLLKLLLSDAARRAQADLVDEPEVRASVDAAMAGTYASISEYTLARELGQRALAALPAGESTDFVLKLKANLATWRIDSGEEKDGVADLEAAVAQLRALRPADHVDLLAARSSLAWYRTYFSPDYQHSYDELTDLVTRMREHLGPDQRLTLLTQHRLGILAGDLGKSAEADRWLTELVDIRRRTLGVDHPDTLNALNSLGILRLQEHRFADGATIIGDLLERADRVFGPDHETTIAIVGNMAGALRQSGQLAASESYYRRAYEGMLKRYGAADRRTLMFQNNLGNFLWEAGRPQEAEALQRPSMEALRAMLGADHPATAELLLGLGRTLTALKRRDEAVQLLTQSAQIRRRLLPADSPELVEVEAALRAAQALQ